MIISYLRYARTHAHHSIVQCIDFLKPFDTERILHLDYANAHIEYSIDEQLKLNEKKEGKKNKIPNNIETCHHEPSRTEHTVKKTRTSECREK